ncbi:RNA polymerase sigma factor RpoH [Shewanella gelidimarina]|uniref:RNA polymerase sigma factor RpoH n=1 Tax=Shewanella gelidimarina TaxID=56813 RepID=UPI00200BCC63|nr:RNA polymerase sigma factor RpoH [Shewanella gelidimarina]MCL1059907.1 RNA polymerase sigma factor RpoH [Shewanella gelidimarina]
MKASTSTSLECYINYARNIPRLDPQEEQELAKKLNETGSKRYLDKLTISQLGFVVHIAKGYKGYGLPFEDLIQEGNIGLMKAIQKFDYNVGVRLSTFAVHWIKAEICEYVLKNWRLVKVATTKEQRKLFFNLRSFKSHLGRFSVEESQALAEKLGISIDTVIEMETRMEARDDSFDATLNEDGNEGYQKSFTVDTSSDIAKNIEDEQWRAHKKDKLLLTLTSLNERSRNIIHSRWLSNKKKTLNELSETHKVSAERIRQLEKEAFSILLQADRAKH